MQRKILAVAIPVAVAIVLLAAFIYGPSPEGEEVKPGFGLDEEHGYVATVWANIVDSPEVSDYPGGWEFKLNVNPERAQETTGVVVVWPNGTRTDLDPDFREGLHPLGSIFENTSNSRFVKYGAGLGWPEIGTYRFLVSRVDGANVEMTVDYVHKLLGPPENVEIFWENDILHVNFDLPEGAVNWGVSLSKGDGPLYATKGSSVYESGIHVAVEFGESDGANEATGIGIAMTNDQNIRGTSFDVPAH